MDAALDFRNFNSERYRRDSDDSEEEYFVRVDDSSAIFAAEGLCIRMRSAE